MTCIRGPASLSRIDQSENQRGLHDVVLCKLQRAWNEEKLVSWGKPMRESFMTDYSSARACCVIKRSTDPVNPSTRLRTGITFAFSSLAQGPVT